MAFLFGASATSAASVLFGARHAFSAAAALNKSSNLLKELDEVPVEGRLLMMQLQALRPALELALELAGREAFAADVVPAVELARPVLTDVEALMSPIDGSYADERPEDRWAAVLVVLMLMVLLLQLLLVLVLVVLLVVLLLLVLLLVVLLLTRTNAPRTVSRGSAGWGRRRRTAAGGSGSRCWRRASTA